MESGVPQGSILGPLEFILFNNDIPEVLSTGTSIGIFADDTKIFRCIRTIRDCILLQYDINKITAWCTKWGLRFNTNKCHIISVCSGIPKLLYQYTLGDLLLKRVEDIVDLGININSRLKWNIHIEQTVSKAFRRLWLLIRTVGFSAPLKLKRTLYITMVRSIVEFGSSIWSPTSQELIKYVESLQRKATNIITNNPRRGNPNHLDYKTRLQICNLLPLTFRREMNDLILFLKSLNASNGYNCSKYVKFQVATTGVRTRNQTRGLTIKIPPNRYAASAQFYPVRISKLWNSLPIKLRQKLIGLDDKDKIKQVLYPFYKQKFTSTFDSDNICTWLQVCLCAKCVIR